MAEINVDEITYNINISPLPTSCRNCPFYMEDISEDVDYAGQYTHKCMFGVTEFFGNLIERPKTCPL